MTWTSRFRIGVGLLAGAMAGGCGGGSGGEPTSGAGPTPVTPLAAPDPVVNRATVAGVDSNSNGIRDDVEIAIQELAPAAVAASAAYAQLLQAELTGQASATLEERSRLYCAGGFPGAPVALIEELTLDTDARRSAMARAKLDFNLPECL